MGVSFSHSFTKERAGISKNNHKVVPGRLGGPDEPEGSGGQELFSEISLSPRFMESGCIGNGKKDRRIQKRPRAYALSFWNVETWQNPWK